MSSLKKSEQFDLQNESRSKLGLEALMTSSIISVHTGQCGNQVGHSFWRMMCEEHGLNSDGTPRPLPGGTHGDWRATKDSKAVFFNQVLISFLSLCLTLFRSFSLCLSFSISLSNLSLLSYPYVFHRLTMITTCLEQYWSIWSRASSMESSLQNTRSCLPR